MEAIFLQMVKAKEPRMCLYMKRKCFCFRIYNEFVSHPDDIFDKWSELSLSFCLLYMPLTRFLLLFFHKNKCECLSSNQHNKFSIKPHTKNQENSYNNLFSLSSSLYVSVAFMVRTPYVHNSSKSLCSVYNRMLMLTINCVYRWTFTFSHVWLWKVSIQWKNNECFQKPWNNAHQKSVVFFFFFACLEPRTRHMHKIICAKGWSNREW